MGHYEAWSLAVPRAATFTSVKKGTDRAVSGTQPHTAANTMHGPDAMNAQPPVQPGGPAPESPPVAAAQARAVATSRVADVESVARTRLRTVASNAELAEVAALLSGAQISLVVVRDAASAAVGIVTETSPGSASGHGAGRLLHHPSWRSDDARLHGRHSGRPALQSAVVDAHTGSPPRPAAGCRQTAAWHVERVSWTARPADGRQSRRSAAAPLRCGRRPPMKMAPPLKARIETDSFFPLTCRVAPCGLHRPNVACASSRSGSSACLWTSCTRRCRSSTPQSR